VGCGGENEVLDIRLMKAVGNAEIMEKLTEAMPNGIEITAVYEQKSKLTDIKWAENEITFKNVSVTDETCRAIEEMFTKPVIMMKRSKSGEKECDITSLMRSVKAECESDTMTVTAITSADQENYLNPEYVAQAIEREFAVSGEKGSHWITRKKLFTADGVTEFI